MSSKPRKVHERNIQRIRHCCVLKWKKSILPLIKCKWDKKQLFTLISYFVPLWMYSFLYRLSLPLTVAWGMTFSFFALYLVSAKCSFPIFNSFIFRSHEKTIWTRIYINIIKNGSKSWDMYIFFKKKIDRRLMPRAPIYIQMQYWKQI